MRLTTVILLFLATAASLATGLASDPTFAWTARLVLALAFSGAVVAFALTLPRRHEQGATLERPSDVAAAPGVDPVAGLRDGARS